MDLVANNVVRNCRKLYYSEILQINFLHGKFIMFIGSMTMAAVDDNGYVAQ